MSTGSSAPCRDNCSRCGIALRPVTRPEDIHVVGSRECQALAALRSDFERLAAVTHRMVVDATNIGGCSCPTGDVETCAWCVTVEDADHVLKGLGR